MSRKVQNGGRVELGQGLFFGGIHDGFRSTFLVKTSIYTNRADHGPIAPSAVITEMAIRTLQQPRRQVIILKTIFLYIHIYLSR